MQSNLKGYRFNIPPTQYLSVQIDIYVLKLNKESDHIEDIYHCSWKKSPCKILYNDEY